MTSKVTMISKSFLGLSLWFFIATAAMPFAVASVEDVFVSIGATQEEPSQPAPAPAPVPVPAPPAAAQPVAAQPCVGEAAPPEHNEPQVEIIDESANSGSIQSIAFKKDWTIREALRYLALKYHKNIVPSEKVEGNITVTNLYNVTFEEALQAILGTNKYEIKGNFIRVFTLDEFQKDKTRFATDVITLYYINASEAQKLVTPMLSDSGKIASTSAASVDTEAGKGGDTVAVHDQLVISDYPEKIETIKRLIESIDVRPPQILIEVTVIEAKLDETTKFGIDLNSIDGVSVAKGADGIMTDGLAGAVTGTSGLTVGVTNDHLAVFIRALEEITDTTVLANPKIIALNKQAGKLLIGRRDGYPAQKTLTEGGNSTQSVEFLETGTKLEFRPFICKDGFIRMEIFPEQSSGAVDPTTSLPSSSTTAVKTNIMVEDGKTVVIGGLFQEKTVLGRAQVPLLGDIPVIGNLFKKFGDQSIRTELIVLMTPHIIQTPDQADGTKRLQDVKRIADDARENICWMSRVKISEDRYRNAVRFYLDGNLESALAELSADQDMQRTCNEPKRLMEKITSELRPDAVGSIERIMTDKVEKEESEKWLRR